METAVNRRFKTNRHDGWSFSKQKSNLFANQQSIQFFTALSLPVDYLQIGPGQWCYNSEFRPVLKYFKALEVLNDTAERDVSLIQEFNAYLTRMAEQKQFI